MSFDPKTLALPLQGAASAAVAAAAFLPEPAKTILNYTAVALRFGAELAAKGQDPISAIERIHAADPALQGVESAWADVLREKHGPKP